MDVHLVMDNYATHKTQLIGQEAALARSPDADQFILAQSGRTFLRAHHRAQNRARHLSQRGGVTEITSFVEHHMPTRGRSDGPSADILSPIESFCAYNSPAKV